jgi:hypothetical protein
LCSQLWEKILQEIKKNIKEKKEEEATMINNNATPPHVNY